MKKLFASIFLALLIIPAFSLSFEGSYLGFDGSEISGFKAGLTSSNDIFNISTGLYYDEHKVEVKENTNYDYEYNEYKYKRKDNLFGPYIKADWALFPIKVNPNLKIGLNFAIQLSIVHSNLATFELPTNASLGLQVRFRKFDVLFGYEYVDGGSNSNYTFPSTFTLYKK